MLAFFRVMNYLKTASSTHLMINYSWVHEEFAFDQLWFILSAESILKDTLLSTYDERVLCVQKQWCKGFVKACWKWWEYVSKYQSVCNEIYNDIYTVYRVNKKRWQITDHSKVWNWATINMFLNKSGVIINHNKLVLLPWKFLQWKQTNKRPQHVCVSV